MASDENAVLVTETEGRERSREKGGKHLLPHLFVE